MEQDQEKYGGEDRRKSQQGYMGDNRRQPAAEMPFEEDVKRSTLDARQPEDEPVQGGDGRLPGAT